VCTGQQRPTRSGCAADVYEITPAGRQYLQQLKSRSNRQGAKEQR
jgi:DNA-binding PadR family transcriptional regulator